MENTALNDVNKTRRAGVLLHPSSLPGSEDNGDIGHQAYRFIEFLSQNNYKVWQMLPLGPTHDDKSPYQCLSSHAGNPALISLDWLIDKGWLDFTKVSGSKSESDYRAKCIQEAGKQFYLLCDEYWTEQLDIFVTKHDYWLADYALFIALKEKNTNKPWYEWPDDERHYDILVLNVLRDILQSSIKQTMFEQFVFFTQWHEVRNYARQHGVELFGDMPIFVARDSADVWSRRENFLINHDGEMEFIAGVPPDAFSETGQRWGNPLYDWEYMQSHKFDWWKNRFKTQLELFDMIRLDHFRGLQACWHIPQVDDTAINGEWVNAPGKELLDELFLIFDHLPLVAEDLGVITDEVIALKNTFDLPGMKVLQFAFDGNNKNPHLPHSHELNDVVYTGTHDNDTSLGWAEDPANYNIDYFESYTVSQGDDAKMLVLSMIRLAMASVSFLCVIPMQDILMLDSSARMNTPGTIGGNWTWRFEWQQLKPDINQQISQFMFLYQR
jgi:4-alpha-glucanotransferase